MKQAKLSYESQTQFISFFQTFQTQESPFISFSDIQALKNSQCIHKNSLKTTTKSSRSNTSCAILKLNGGLGTSMGCMDPKSSLHVKADDTFLDIIAKSCLNHSKNIPLLLMNSFKSATKTEQILSKYPQLNCTHFMQNKVPRILAKTLTPCVFENDDDNWCPPGHGDVFIALHKEGLIDTLINEGIEYLFISNADNLGAQFDDTILTYMKENNCDFLMECTEKLASDKKGGIICQHKNTIKLVEIAQVNPKELEHFYDTKRFSYFNTNNIWVFLPKLKKLLAENKLNTQLIVNKKTIQGEEIIQLESAMGSAISCFETPRVLIVDRSRFLPVKTTSDLLYLRSDAISWENNQLKVHRSTPTHISLSSHYQSISQLDQLILQSLSLKDCESLSLEGPFHINSNVSFSGAVTLSNASQKRIHLESNSHFENVQVPFNHHN